jgi:glycosyltransferase involved in cell wall biosynthesis
MSLTIPKVSVLTPIYNTNPEHLREMIESILNQTFTDFEFLILNDSPENIELDKIVKSYKDERIKYFKNEKNLGITPSRNKLLKMARGEYVAIFDHDDISVPDRLAQEVEYLDTNPHISVVSGWLQYFGDRNDTLKNPEHDLKIRTFLTQILNNKQRRKNEKSIIYFGNNHRDCWNLFGLAPARFRIKRCNGRWQNFGRVF